jgi:PadR family transcriptional regulator AphA
MSRSRSRVTLSSGEWSVLALVAERPSHGFLVAKALAPDGEVGRIWTLPKPLVYRALRELEAALLVEPCGIEQARGPTRTLLRATPRGRRLVAAWLREPVEHVRDARSLLMLKLLFLDRAGIDATDLLRSQLIALAPLEVSFEEQCAEAEGFDATLARWRLESVRALRRVIEITLAEL